VSDGKFGKSERILCAMEYKIRRISNTHTTKNGEFSEKKQ
jgi:hypothetical protein